MGEDLQAQGGTQTSETQIVRDISKHSNAHNLFLSKDSTLSEKCMVVKEEGDAGFVYLTFLSLRLS